MYLFVVRVWKTLSYSQPNGVSLLISVYLVYTTMTFFGPTIHSSSNRFQSHDFLFILCNVSFLLFSTPNRFMHSGVRSSDNERFDPPFLSPSSLRITPSPSFLSRYCDFSLDQRFFNIESFIKVFYYDLWSCFDKTYHFFVTRKRFGSVKFSNTLLRDRGRQNENKKYKFVNFFFAKTLTVFFFFYRTKGLGLTSHIDQW